MSTHAPSPDSMLERQSRRFRRPAWWFVLIAIVIEVPGILLLVLGHTWVIALGITLIALGSIPATVGVGLLISAAVTWWAARRRPFA
jgi:hypothetical protein